MEEPAAETPVMNGDNEDQTPVEEEMMTTTVLKGDAGRINLPGNEDGDAEGKESEGNDPSVPEAANEEQSPPAMDSMEEQRDEDTTTPVTDESSEAAPALNVDVDDSNDDDDDDDDPELEALAKQRDESNNDLGVPNVIVTPGMPVPEDSGESPPDFTQERPSDEDDGIVEDESPDGDVSDKQKPTVEEEAIAPVENTQEEATSGDESLEESLVDRPVPSPPDESPEANEPSDEQVEREPSPEPPVEETESLVEDPAPAKEAEAEAPVEPESPTDKPEHPLDDPAPAADETERQAEEQEPVVEEPVTAAEEDTVEELPPPAEKEEEPEPEPKADEPELELAPAEEPEPVVEELVTAEEKDTVEEPPPPAEKEEDSDTGTLSDSGSTPKHVPAAYDDDVNAVQQDVDETGLEDDTAKDSNMEEGDREPEVTTEEEQDTPAPAEEIVNIVDSSEDLGETKPEVEEEEEEMEAPNTEEQVDEGVEEDKGNQVVEEPLTSSEVKVEESAISFPEEPPDIEEHIQSPEVEQSEEVNGKEPVSAEAFFSEEFTSEDAHDEPEEQENKPPPIEEEEVSQTVKSDSSPTENVEWPGEEKPDSNAASETQSPVTEQPTETEPEPTEKEPEPEPAKEPEPEPEPEKAPEPEPEPEKAPEPEPSSPNSDKMGVKGDNIIDTEHKKKDDRMKESDKENVSGERSINGRSGSRRLDTNRFSQFNKSIEDTTDSSSNNTEKPKSPVKKSGGGINRIDTLRFARFEMNNQQNGGDAPQPKKVTRNFVINKGAAKKRFGSDNADSGLPNNNECCVCNKRVYPMEKITADNKPFHKTCFRCTECRKILSLGNFAALNGVLYCKPHFTQLFKLKGNYNDGFAPGASKSFQSKVQSGTNRT